MRSSITCRIRVAGELGPEWTSWFDGLAIVMEGEGVTALDGELPDQAALHGLLASIRDLGLDLISVETWARRQDETND